MNNKCLTVAELTDLGFATNLEILERYLSLRGRVVLDIGCGSLTFSKQLAELGAVVTGVDPDPVQAEKNRHAALAKNVNFVEASADQLPFPADSVDGVTFSYSLHHIPAALYPRVFGEVKRVLRSDGFLYVIEPIDCPLNRVMRLFHDEDQARADAQTALAKIAKPMFAESLESVYRSTRKFESFEDFAEFFTSKSFNTIYTEADVRADEVRKLFEHHGAPNYEFEAPKRMMCLQGLI